MQGKVRLNVIQNRGTSIPVVEGTTCFAMQSKHKVACRRKKCQHWISHKEGLNCVIISAQDGPHTLQKIGQIYGLTRMRICQLEKSIFEKVRKMS